jgi:HD-GYP domain-containing protein (c-di-GMP phosphodiesterase class II)
MEESLRLSQVVATLSHALDVTEGEPPGHAVRTCLIGMRIGERIGLPAEERSALFYALLLKDAGCSANAARLSALFDAPDQVAKARMKRIDWTRPGALTLYGVRTVAPSGSPLKKLGRLRELGREEGVTRSLMAARCERGADIARLIGLPAAAAEAIAALDEHWDGGGHPLGLAGDAIPLLGRILCLAQTVEVFARMAGRAGALEMAARRSGRWFDPALVEALRSLAGDAALWEQLTGDRTPDVRAFEPAEHIVVAGPERLDRVARAFALVVDAKSPYTARHSERVAEIAVGIGRALGFAPEPLAELRRAGLLHDLGKLAVPNVVLDKPGRLTDDEFRIVKGHPALSERIIAGVGPFERIARLAGAHHERLDGRGYFRGSPGTALDQSARVLAVADVCEALSADRPYRAGLDPDSVFEIIGEQAGTALCATAVDGLRASWPQPEPEFTLDFAPPPAVRRSPGAAARSPGSGSSRR